VVSFNGPQAVHLDGSVQVPGRIVEWLAGLTFSCILGVHGQPGI
jgi:hypothetical protein